MSIIMQFLTEMTWSFIKQIYHFLLQLICEVMNCIKPRYLSTYEVHMYLYYTVCLKG